MIVKYDDGYVSTKEKIAREVGYPKAWRDQVGYAEGPVSYSPPDGI